MKKVLMMVMIVGLFAITGCGGTTTEVAAGGFGDAATVKNGQESGGNGGDEAGDNGNAGGNGGGQAEERGDGQDQGLGGGVGHDKHGEDGEDEPADEEIVDKGDCGEDGIAGYVEDISGTVCVYDDLLIGDGQKTTIHAGATVKFAEGKGIKIGYVPEPECTPAGCIMIPPSAAGTLDIAGTADEPVNLVANGDYLWGGIYAIEGALGGTWSNVNFDRAGFGFAPIYFEAGDYDLASVAFTNSAGGAMVMRSAVTGTVAGMTIDASNADIYLRLNLSAVSVSGLTTTGQSIGLRIDYGSNSVSGVAVNGARCTGVMFYGVTAGAFADITVSGGGTGEGCASGPVLGCGVVANNGTDAIVDGLTVDGGAWSKDMFIDAGSSLDF